MTDRSTSLQVVLLVLGSLLSFACGRADSPVEAPDGIRLDLADPDFQRIHTFRYQLQADSLLSYLSHPRATNRYLAALAYGSFREGVPIDSLAVLLDDPVDDVRAAAAFSLGQTGQARAEPLLLEGFEQYDTLGVYREANRAILEAVGKCGSASSLRSLSTITTYGPQDSALLEGQAWGLYRFALRGMHTPEGTALMVRWVTADDLPLPVRLVAANYLYRSQQIRIPETRVPALARAAIGDPDPRIRMALAIGMAKTKSPLALEALENLFLLDPDYRVKCNVISALPNFDYRDVRDLAMTALRDSNRFVAERAATFFLEHGQARDGFTFYSTARSIDRWEVAIPLYGAVLRHLPTQYRKVRNSAINRLRELFRDPSPPFARIAALRAMAENPWNYQNIYDDGFSAEEGLVRQGAVNALASISDDPRFSSQTFAQLLSPLFREAIASGDPAMMGPAAEALARRGDTYREAYQELDFLESAYREAQSYELRFALGQALDSLTGGNRAARLTTPRRPLDWAALEAAGRRPRLAMATDSGTIVLELLPEEAPGTVASMLQLAASGHYRNTFFYRVVPNFVAQGAQPLDYAATDFTLSSECTPRHYLQDGLLGMASSGPHTESNQFFITFSPTPHLDGSYTLFGRVVEGMDVVHRLGRGSAIENLTLVTASPSNEL